MTLRHALLGLLDEEPASGYELMKVFNTSMANVWPATQSQVYTELNRMSDLGLIAVDAPGPRRRKDYRITDSGRSELRDWLRDPPPAKPIRSDLLLRVFFLDLLSPAEARGVFLAHKDAVLHERNHLIDILQQIGDDTHALSLNGRIALEFGLRKAQMQLGWAEWALEQLDTRPQLTPAQPH